MRRALLVLVALLAWLASPVLDVHVDAQAPTVRNIGTNPPGPTTGNSATGESVSPCTVSKPSGLASGDLMVAGLGQRASSATFTYTGWNSIDKNTQSTTLTGETIWKIADSTDAAASNFTFATDQAGTLVCGMAAITAGTFNAANPIGAHSGQGNASSTTATAPTMTPTTANSLILFFVTIYNDDIGFPVGSYAMATDDITWTEGWDFSTTAGVDGGAAMAYGSRVQTTATGNITATKSSAAVTVSQAVAINPAATSSPRQLMTLGCCEVPW